MLNSKTSKHELSNSKTEIQKMIDKVLQSDNLLFWLQVTIAHFASFRWAVTK